MPRAKGTVLNSAKPAKRTPSKDPRDTPAMRQYFAFKERHPGCVLFFRMGDFYEMFDEDAVTVAKALNLTLTERTPGMPMAGVPHHAAESYLSRLIAQGFRVAVCEQVQDPKDAKGVVDRAVTRVVTPGTLVDESLLDDNASSTVAAVLFTADGDDAPCAIAGIDLSTGAFWLADRPAAEAVDELARRGATELLFCETVNGDTPPRVQRVIDALNIAATPRPSWHFRAAEALERLTHHFAVASLAGFGIDDDDPALPAAAAVLAYLQDTQTSPTDASTSRGNDAALALAKRSLDHIAPPSRDDPAGVMRLDAVSLRSLEITQTVRSRSIDGSLLGVFLKGESAPRTAMGRRTIREWLCAPSAERDQIDARHAAVATLLEDHRLRDELRSHLTAIADVARIAARVALWRATPRDLVALGTSLATLDPVAKLTADIPAFAPQHNTITATRDALTPLATRIASTCVEHPPAHLREGGLVRDGVDQQLDAARNTKRNSAEWLAEYQQQLAQAHDLPSLKVGFNKVFGYYIELPAAQARSAPDNFTRKQTLKNAERYITPELKSYEDDVLSADERALERERAIFNDLCERIAAHTRAITRFSGAIAQLDTLACFAEHASRARWSRPEMLDEPALDITEGRHPVLEQTLAGDFVPNDLALATDGNAGLSLITGPNMAGKSTFIRQTALIVLLAHAGSFVPAQRARVGLTDRVFTRVGADDALHAGQSTFMVEMTETANILHNATPRSLVVLDEIGRGTSTLDGLSLAWAITEHLAAINNNDANNTATGPRTLFATHYHELTDLAERHPTRIRNLHVAVARDADHGITFVHRIKPGPASESFGVHVAKLAGLPTPVTNRASTLLKGLSVNHDKLATDISRAADTPTTQAPQMSLFTEFLPHPIIEEIKQLDLDTVAPIDAFQLLRDIRNRLDQSPNNTP